MYQIWFNFIAINENFVVLCYSPRARKMFVLPMSSETGWCQCYANILWIQTQPQLVSSWSCLQCTNPPQHSKEQRWRSTWYDRTGQVLVYLLYSYLRPCLHESDAKVERYVCISLSVFFLFWSGGQEMFSINTTKCSGSCNLIFVRPTSFNKNKPWWWCRSPGCWPLICILSAGPCPWFSGRVQCES